MEAELDRIEEGELDWRNVLSDFYQPFRRQLEEGSSKSDEIIREVVSGGETKECSECGRQMVVRWNRFGRFLGCSGYPECRNTEQLDAEKQPEPKPIGEKCPNCGNEMVEREGRFGPFIACSNYPKCKFTRPRTIPGLKCPQCGEGEIGEKRTRRGKPFWGCTRYPDCDWSVWDEPVPVACEQCDAPFMVRKSTKKQGDFLKCLQCNAVVTEEGIPGDTAAGAEPARASGSGAAGGSTRTGASRATGARSKKSAARKSGARRPAGAGAGRSPKGKSSGTSKPKRPKGS
jgi:DNA topoisomerase-1